MEKPFDLEERTFLFAKECRIYIQKLPKTISNIEIIEEGMDVHFIFEGTGFLRYQVRMMTGTLIAVGQHKIGVDDVQRMLDAKDKSACRYNASSCGLYLVEVKYNETN